MDERSQMEKKGEEGGRQSWRRMELQWRISRPIPVPPHPRLAAELHVGSAMGPFLAGSQVKRD